MSFEGSVVRPIKPPNLPSPKTTHAALKPPPPLPQIVPTNINNGNADTKAKPLFPVNKVSNAAATEFGRDPELKLTGFVGFDSLPYQFVRKTQNNGHVVLMWRNHLNFLQFSSFQFNMLCVGETGMGKTTLVESLFNMKMEFEPCNHELKTVELRTKTHGSTF